MGRTLPPHLLELAEKFPGKEMFVFYDENMKKSSITYKELYNLASKFAHILKQAGVKSGQAVCLAVPTSLELAVAAYGVMFTGGRPVCFEIAPGKEKVFPHCVNKSECNLLVVRPTSYDMTWNAIKDKVTNIDQPIAKINDSSMPGLKNVMFVNRTGDSDKCQDFLTMLKSYPESYVNNDIKESDICGLWMTSGTTGMPKLVMQSHLALSKGSFDEGGLIPGYKNLLHNSPWSWAIASPFDTSSGATRYQPEYWRQPADPYKVIAQILEKEDIESAFLTPVELEGIQKHWDIKKKKIVNTLCVAGYPVSYSLCKNFLTLTNNLFIRYGCSELITICSNTITDIANYKDFDCGKLCKGTIVKFVNDNFEPVPKGTPGRLMLKSIGVFKGYMNEKAKTEEALTEDGWFLTSDAGYLDDRDHLIVVGRYDYVIKHKGKIYYPSILEKPIQKLSGVKTAVVVPIPDKVNHHDICACVVRLPGSTITEADVKKAFANVVAGGVTNMVEPQHVLFIDGVTINERGKMNTNEIITLATKKIKG